MQNPVPKQMSFTDFYEQIWGTEQIMEVPLYGYLQFKILNSQQQPSNWLTIPPSIVWKSLRRSVSYVLLETHRTLLRYQHSLAAESKAILPDPFLWNPSGDQGCLIIPLLDLF